MSGLSEVFAFPQQCCANICKGGAPKAFRCRLAAWLVVNLFPCAGLRLCSCLCMTSTALQDHDAKINAGVYVCSNGCENARPAHVQRVSHTSIAGGLGLLQLSLLMLVVLALVLCRLQPSCIGDCALATRAPVLALVPLTLLVEQRNMW